MSGEDLVARLRHMHDFGSIDNDFDDIGRAADEIERLRARSLARAQDIITLGQEVGRLKVALERIRDDPGVSSLSGDPTLWPSTIAKEALR